MLLAFMEDHHHHHHHHHHHYHHLMKLLVTVTFFYPYLVSLVYSATDPGDLAILNQFRKGLKNPELLKWPDSGDDDDPCGPPSWPHVFCSRNRVTQIQVQNMNLKGPLPSNLNQLSMLTNLGLQRNQFTGPLPSLNGLSGLRWAYLDYNQFDTIPSDFFHGLDSLEVLALDSNPLNTTTGWSLPIDLQNSAQLQNLSLMSCNLAGPLPDFLGTFSSLGDLKLSMNRISGGIPATFNESLLRTLWLNGQSGGGMTGPIDVIGTMTSLTSLWLHGNHFSGRIPQSISGLTQLKDFNVNSNDLVGLVPDGLATLSLDNLDLNNNQFMGPVPKFKASNFTYSSNQFCQPDPGVPCAPQVTALLGFLDDLNYPSRLVSTWSGNDPCEGPWLGLSCIGQEVNSLHLPKFNLSGTLSPSIANLGSLTRIDLGSNKLTSVIPSNWTNLKSLTFLDLSNNDLSPPQPKFNPSMKLDLTGNPLFQSDPPRTPSPKSSPPTGSPADTHQSSPPIGLGTNTSTRNPSTRNPSTRNPSTRNPDTIVAPISSKRSKKSNLVAIVASVAAVVSLVLLVVSLCIYLCKKKKVNSHQAPSSLVIHPRDPSDSDNAIKIAIANDTVTSVGSGSGSQLWSRTGESHVIESGNLIISVQVLRNVTKNFAPENELGRGGFGVVYKGQLDDGTKIAVKRMESGVISNKALDEFEAEIAVLSKVRHRHLVSLLGYSTEGPERLLVYEYMPQGALSRHLFHWKSFKLEPLSWKRRLNIALDVARAMDYLHNLAHQSFIHRDLKSSNILLGDDFKAKVSDFGLVKLAPDGAKSVITRLAGTFGYLAPEYAVTGKITTKADVFSYGVVLMELLTGLMALDEDRPEESQYLAAWFWSIRSDKEKLMAAVDPALNANEETFETISIIAELAGHCTAREPNQRPDMGHAVNVLSPLVEKWKPMENEAEEYCGIDYSLPLTQMVKGWQEAEGKDYSSSYVDLDDSKSSIPARPTGFADSFTSADGR
ncbi:receptor protein kinase TMK1-like [Cynara cardunculus var. scolymus]|uniref:receptor protein kinase TMK1-like n=1 Tax=Cynara cardunculus var. scolymus TaxID=59895 RepID=UPI000D62529D|nr:receptor protein kinase TMK1-like [Cynara cardunculus var. scolymus]